jgi:hypothetical protein
MSKEQAVIHYTAAMALFRNLLSSDVITEADLLKMEPVLAEKYGLSLLSIYR